ncbi:MAG: type IV pilus biogenesis protein PilP [Herminiimonas sp.]|nr:type IV pilus biogenesis protein PilP [Herminiimonas sp.]
MRNKLSLIVASGRQPWTLSCLLLGLWYGPASGAETTSESLTRIEAETLVLKAQERQLAVKAKILQLQTDIATRQAGAGQMASLGTPGDPTVQSIEGIGGTLFATLQIENGSRIDVKPGDILPNNMRVVSIKANEVVVSTDKQRRIRLATGSAAPMAAASGTLQGIGAAPAVLPPAYMPPAYMPLPALPTSKATQVPALPLQAPRK